MQLFLGVVDTTSDTFFQRILVKQLLLDASLEYRDAFARKKNLSEAHLTVDVADVIFVGRVGGLTVGLETSNPLACQQNDPHLN